MKIVEVRAGVEDALSTDLQEMVAKETRRALRDHEEQLTALVRAAVHEAISELLNPAETEAVSS
jgi:hypothetical protein